MNTSEKPEVDFWRLEYENLPALIAHWDAHFWQKSQWFFAVESALLGAVGFALKDTFLSGVAPARPTLLFLVAACVFNFWICYVWFRTNRTNREYLDPLLERGREIEAAHLKDEIGTFSAQKRFQTLPKHRRHSSRRWEKHLPSGFALAWAALLLAAALYSNRFWLALGTLSLSLVVLLLLERFHPKRQG
jgi:hypothetical protein